MQPLQMDLVWRRNAPEAASFTLMGEDGVTPVDFTQIALRMQVRLCPGTPDPALVSLGMAASGSPGFFLDDAVGGQFTLTPPASAVLLALPSGPDTPGTPFALSFDILLLHPDGKAEPFIEGRVLLPEGVTR